MSTYVGVSPTLTPNCGRFSNIIDCKRTRLNGGRRGLRSQTVFVIFGQKYNKMKILLILQTENSVVISILTSTTNDFTRTTVNALIKLRSSAGYLPLRQAVVKYMKEYLKVEATEQSIMITSGAQQALHLIVQCLLNPVMPSLSKVLHTVIPYRYSNQRVFVFSRYLSMNTVLIQTMCKNYIESIVLK